MKKKVCPNCGSENVKPDTSEKTSFMHGNISSWVCKECGYNGIMPEKENENGSEKT